MHICQNGGNELHSQSPLGDNSNLSADRGGGGGAWGGGAGRGQVTRQKNIGQVLVVVRIMTRNLQGKEDSKLLKDPSRPPPFSMPSKSCKVKQNLIALLSAVVVVSLVSASSLNKIY